MSKVSICDAFLKMAFGAIVFVATLAHGQSSKHDPFVGAFSGSGLTLTLGGHNGNYTGKAVFEGQDLQIVAQKTSENTISGTYTMQGMQLPFQAKIQGNTLTLSAGGELYSLAKQNTTEATATSRAAALPSEQSTDSQNMKMNLAPGEVGDPDLGFKFKAPEGWLANKLEGGYLLGSQTQKGFILILPHQYNSLDELRAAAREGLQDENGTRLQISGEVGSFGENGIAVDFSGLVEWQKARARAIGLLSPHGGGVSIIVAVEEKSFGPDYVNLAEQVAKSMKFFKPETPPISEEWRQTLSGARLTYLWSYYSGGSSDGSYVGGSQTTKIDLCPQGYFMYYDSNQMAADGGFGGSYNVSGHSGGNNQGNGQWEVAARGQQPILRLKFNDGRIFEYVLSMQDGKTYLDDKRYFRTYSNDSVEEHRPQCW